MIEVNKNTLAGAFGALGKLICRTSPLVLCKSIKVEAVEGKLRLSTCGVNEEVSFELETGARKSSAAWSGSMSSGTPWELTMPTPEKSGKIIFTA